MGKGEAPCSCFQAEFSPDPGNGRVCCRVQLLQDPALDGPKIDVVPQEPHACALEAIFLSEGQGFFVAHPEAPGRGEEPDFGFFEGCFEPHLVPEGEVRHPRHAGNESPELVNGERHPE